MPERKVGYEAKLDEVVETLKHSPEELNNVLNTSAEVVNAASDMTKDEMALVSAYVRSDLKEFADTYQKDRDRSPFYLMVSNSIWEGLLEITDRTQVEWRELFMDLDHKGLYQAGDIIGLGYLVCDKCTHKSYYNHPTIIEPCKECGHDGFTRLALKP
ncbi:zinc ribbon-containing protein [Vibrio sp. SCSIO 43136]|uniref:zinc ribbon-containing protein n=1 Tax=Vibrio sp. SCSIO 43136 TaxID=2819101 RepID=UPI0020753D8A|nr:zinc ribbon-containing protein [Vibrio sp. SCSIO 43136]USD64655.1 zinc ribbon-containing protein [Vibrio sp. SCSIO 43136]